MKNNLLAVNALCENKPIILVEIAALAKKLSCSMLRCHVNKLGSELAIALLIGGNWNTIAKMEAGLEKIQQTYGIFLQANRTEQSNYEHPMMPYAIQVLAPENPGIIHSVSHFFTEQRIDITSLTANRYVALNCETPMFQLNMTINIPINTHVAELRERFIVYCDDLNLDAIFEPDKG